ncbi:SET domain-containing protein [Trematosphaeria pertusa]|uniref:SET domain-containing protein n=1 Tax=Trematosphaeria pertusa TaxID=390896 RepID=A0A6A6IPH2_9PLEO|nr:SET domain-containing protein [Trematosphaeria pertusa]KAF2251968.1 SET domain-containing protein [Trematosphaeria pertusa]
MSPSSSAFSRLLPPSLLVPLLLATRATALFETGSSPAIQDPLVNPPPTTCPVLQDGITSNTFPWTHNPTCVTAVLPSTGDHGHLGVHQDFCVYTNTNFNSGRGISLVTTPEVAAELMSETYSPFFEEVASESSWEMKETASKGMGLFAKRNIKAGETLILKSPALFIARDALDTPSRSRRRLLIETAVKQLPEKTRELVMVLSRRGGQSEYEDIIHTNSHRAKVWDGSSHLVLVPEAARINHACRPNAYYRFDDFTLNFDVFALRDIKPGEELTFTYGFSYQPREARLDALENHWGFTCTCPLCTANSTVIAASDERLKKINEIKAVLPTEQKDIPQMLGLLPELIGLMEEEDLIIELPMYEEIMAYTWSSFGIEDRAKYWAERAREHWAVLAGPESWEAKRTGQLENDVKGHYTWMSWEEDPWEGVGHGHPWGDDSSGKHDHDH